MAEKLEQGVVDETGAIVDESQVEAAAAAAAAAAAEEEEGLDDELEEGEKKELWMTEGDQKPDGVPVSTHIRMKQKLKGRITDKDEELERLKAENLTLKAGTVLPAPVKVERPERPREEAFDTIAEYNTALDAYEDTILDIRLNRDSQARDIKTATNVAKEDLSKAVDSHYTRASKLILDSGISTEVYQEADTKVRQAIEAVKPGMGEVITDQIISVVGEGSEKILYFLGRNKNALNEFTNLLATDSSGLKASIFLGQQREKLLNTTKRTSKAPTPGVDLSSEADADTSSKSMSFLKKRKAAIKKGNLQAAYNAKKEAKAAGVDVSKW
ncbi:unnamed protein product [marine sediment metagenome]|uniref:Uncharacterized protein n=1 Tax=marine sediment metagenome TaxID=412755 RepID=X0SR74_9ZZZZ